MSSISLKGENLGKRQHELNKLVQEAIDSKIPYEEIKKHEEYTDLDRIYKIDVASKLKNVDYLIETLKSGDSFYISRVLKCNWLFQDPQYSSIINPDYLHHNVLPDMPTKMSTKLLNTLTVNIIDENRAEIFCDYFMSLKKENYACKFLRHTSDSYKDTFIRNNQKMIISHKIKLKDICKNSFELAEAFLRQDSRINLEILKQLSHLHYKSPKQYIDLLEKYYNEQLARNYNRFGINMSKEILKKNRVNVLKNPFLYSQILVTQVILKSLTMNDLKSFISGFFPSKVEDFWKNQSFIRSRIIFTEHIPLDERFLFVKSVFQKKYPGERFETDEKFYNDCYLKLMTDQQRHDWASEELKKGFTGKDIDYNLYRYLLFSLAFNVIKDVIRKTEDQASRLKMILIAVETTRTETDLEQLLQYFWERHANERQQDKLMLLNKVFKKFNPFLFGDLCWDWLHKIFASIHIYSSDRGMYGINVDIYLQITLLYNIIHDKEMHEYLTQNIRNWPYGYIRNNLNKIPEHFHTMIFNVLIENMTTECNKYSEFNSENIYNDKHDIQLLELRRLLQHIIDVFNVFKRGYKELPAKVLALIELDEKHHYFPKLKEDNRVLEKWYSNDELLSALKSDIQTLVHNLPKFDHRGRINKVLQKLKIYFADNNDCLSFFYSQLSNEKANRKSLHQAVVAINVLEKSDNLIEFVQKYKPEVGKIEHHTIDQRVKDIQECICRYIYFARPHLPLDITMSFVKGDYIHFFIPSIGALAANLPTAERLKFVQMLLNHPNSIQKHGLRLAYKHFTLQELKQLTNNVWSKTKNVSLRKLIFTSTYVVFLKKSDEDMFKILKSLMVDLNIDDSDEIFALLWKLRPIPDDFVNEYIKTAYEAVIRLPDTPTAWKYRNNILSQMSCNMKLIDVEFLDDFFMKYIKERLVDKGILQILPTYKKEEQNLKFYMLVIYLLENDTNEIRDEKIEKIIKPFLQILFDNWQETFNGQYVYQNELTDFRNNLEQIAFNSSIFKIDVTPIFDLLLNYLKERQPKYYNHFFGMSYKLAALLSRAFFEVKKIYDDSCLIAEKFANLLTGVLVESKVYSVLAFKIAQDIEKLSTKVRFTKDSYYFKIHLGKSLLETKHKIATYIGLYIYANHLRMNVVDDYRQTLFDLYTEANDELKQFILYEFKDKEGFDLNNFICLETSEIKQ